MTFRWLLVVLLSLLVLDAVPNAHAQPTPQGRSQRMRIPAGVYEVASADYQLPARCLDEDRRQPGRVFTNGPLFTEPLTASGDLRVQWLRNGVVRAEEAFSMQPWL